MERMLKVDNAYMADLRKGLGLSDEEIIKNALGILKWAKTESEQGRLILSATPEGAPGQILTSPLFDKAQPKK